MGRTASGLGVLVCPLCEAGVLRPEAGGSGCGSYGRRVGGDVLKTLEQIAALPEALGRHACECGHPEMRLLPDGVYHCPACGSEVTPLGPGRGLDVRTGGGGGTERAA